MGGRFEPIIGASHLQRSGEVVLAEGFFGEGEGLFGDGVGALGADFQGVDHIVGAVFEMFAAGADGVDEGVEDLDEFFLAGDVADFALAVGGFVVGDPLFVGVEGFVEDPEGVVFDGAGVGDADAFGVGVHAHDLGFDGVGVVGEEDGVVEGLGHFEEVAVWAWGAEADESVDAAELGFDDGEEAAGVDVVFVFGLGIDAAVELVESSGDFAGHFEVGELVFADGDVDGTEGEDVGGLSDGVEREAEGVVFAEAFVADFVLEGGVSHDAVEGQEHGEEEGEFIDGGDFGLDEHGGFVGVDATGEVVGGDFEDGLADFFGLFGAGGEGVFVGDDEEAVERILEGEAVFHGADVVAEV